MVDGKTESTATLDPKELESLQQEKFDYQKLNKILDEMTNDLSDISFELYWNMLLEFVKVFHEMGTVLSLAFQGISMLFSSITDPIPCRCDLQSSNYQKKLL
mgnify:CR=1 FL=1